MVATTIADSGVPVSLPVGSLIGTAFNVISQDQLPHFKQMLCVDNNGFISSSAVVGDMNSGDLKTIVIQQHQNTHHEGSGSNNSQDSNVVNNENSNSITQQNIVWSDATNLEIIPIRCKTTNAELHKIKLGSGGRGRCIKYKDDWYTPSEFEHLCGRGSSKDWKRSIRYGGRSLQALIDAGILTPHATNCSCTACCDDEGAASGPVRLFTPYKRRKRNQVDQELETAVATKKKRNETHIKTEEIYIQDGNVITRNACNREDSWPTLNESLDENTEYLDQTQIVLENSQTLKQLEVAYSTMVRATNDFKRLFLEVKDVFNRKIDQLQNERDAALMAARVHGDMDDPNMVNAMQGHELVSPKKCANCNREALAECSLCRRTPYCSTFCQRKDWNAHQVECTRDPEPAAQQIMLLVDDQS